MTSACRRVEATLTWRTSNRSGSTSASTRRQSVCVPPRRGRSGTRSAGPCTTRSRRTARRRPTRRRGRTGCRASASGTSRRVAAVEVGQPEARRRPLEIAERQPVARRHAHPRAPRRPAGGTSSRQWPRCGTLGVHLVQPVGRARPGWCAGRAARAPPRRRTSAGRFSATGDERRRDVQPRRSGRPGTDRSGRTCGPR